MSRSTTSLFALIPHFPSAAFAETSTRTRRFAHDPPSRSEAMLYVGDLQSDRQFAEALDITILSQIDSLTIPSNQTRLIPQHVWLSRSLLRSSILCIFVVSGCFPDPRRRKRIATGLVLAATPLSDRDPFRTDGRPDHWMPKTEATLLMHSLQIGLPFFLLCSGLWVNDVRNGGSICPIKPIG